MKMYKKKLCFPIIVHEEWFIFWTFLFSFATDSYVFLPLKNGSSKSLAFQHNFPLSISKIYLLFQILPDSLFSRYFISCPINPRRQCLEGFMAQPPKKNKKQTRLYRPSVIFFKENISLYKYIYLNVSKTQISLSYYWILEYSCNHNSFKTQLFVIYSRITEKSIISRIRIFLYNKIMVRHLRCAECR